MEMSGGGPGGGGVGGCGGPCGACKFLRRKCIKESCIFAPYFESSEQGMAHFAAVHRVFGASNASKMLLQLPPQDRLDAVVSLCFEAMSRVRDPVYGCVSHICSLQQQVVNLQAELAHVRAQYSLLQLFSAMPPPPPPPQPPTSSSSTSNVTQCCSSDLDMASFCNLLAQEAKDGLVQDLLVSTYPPPDGEKFRPSTSQ